MMLSPPVSRLVAVSLLFATGWFVVSFVAMPLIDQIQVDRESIAHSRLLLARYKQLEDGLPDVQKALDELDSTSNDRALLATAPPAVMSASLQQTTQGLVAAAGATLRSSRTLPPTTENGFHRVGLNLDVAASTMALTSLLHSVAAAEPVILVEHMVVEVPENDTAAKAPDGQPALGVSLRLASYARPSTPTTESQP